jgi:hypothetical protein
MVQSEYRKGLEAMAVINKLFDFWKQKEIEQGRTIPV